MSAKKSCARMSYNCPLSSPPDSMLTFVWARLQTCGIRGRYFFSQDHFHSPHRVLNIEYRGSRGRAHGRELHAALLFFADTGTPVTCVGYMYVSGGAKEMEGCRGEGKESFSLTAIRYLIGIK